MRFTILFNLRPYYWYIRVHNREFFQAPAPFLRPLRWLIKQLEPEYTFARVIRFSVFLPYIIAYQLHRQSSRPTSPEDPDDEDDHDDDCGLDLYDPQENYYPAIDGRF